MSEKSPRGKEALEIFGRIDGKFTDENVRLWRNICCVNPDIGGNNGSGECKACSIGVRPPPKGEDELRQQGWCHAWYKKSQELQIKERKARIEKATGQRFKQ